MADRLRDSSADAANNLVDPVGAVSRLEESLPWHPAERLGSLGLSEID